MTPTQKSQKQEQGKARFVAERVAKYLKDKHQASRVILFGSLARGAYDENTSDIDLYFEGTPENECDEIVGDTLVKFWRVNLDLWPEARCPKGFEQEIKSSGLNLRTRSRHAHSKNKSFER